MAGAAVRFLRWCSECGCGKRRRLLSAETMSTSTKTDSELVTEGSITTHGMCMQFGLDAAGVPDQPMSSAMRIQLDDDEGGVDRQAKHIFTKHLGDSVALAALTLPGQRICPSAGAAGILPCSRERRRPPSLSCRYMKRRGSRAALAALIPTLKLTIRSRSQRGWWTMMITQKP